MYELNDKEEKQFIKITDAAQLLFGNKVDIEIRFTPTGIGNIIKVWIEPDNTVIEITDYDSW